MLEEHQNPRPVMGSGMMGVAGAREEGTGCYAGGLGAPVELSVLINL